MTGRRAVTLWARAGTVLVTIVLVVIAQNVALGIFFPDLKRLPSDFSPAYFERDLGLAAAPPQTIFLGDSVLWGYRLRPDQTAVALMLSDGCRCRNFALKGGSPPNFYVIARLLERSHVRPLRVVIEINQKALNKLDPSYKTLHPSLAALAAPWLAKNDRDRFSIAASSSGPAAWFDRTFASVSSLYAMRADLRAVFFGDDDGSTAPPPSTSVDDYFGMYDMRPLGDGNTGIAYLRKTLDTFRADGIPVTAFLTPTNHMLLHEFVDRPDYVANTAYLQKVLEAGGATVLNLDASFPRDEFFDNAHLRISGQHRLAGILEKALGEPTPGSARTRS
jgi:hypothetical protein